ncbi:MAG: PIN domain-containing protein [Spirochaetales bacterium]|nr:PIN domain-containing protein [Spirochaetales bacterium]
MNRIYLDTDVLLDFLYQREPFFGSAVRLMALVEAGKVRAYVSTLIIWNLHYFLQKEFGRKEAGRLLKDLRSLLQLISVDARIIDQALSSEIKDFEDSVQFFASQSEKISTIITRNKKDYPRDSVALLTCEEYLIGISH